jgi:non-ribosomal peptide synthase protein (TIGR01720 family)
MCAYFMQHEIDCLKIAPSHLAALQAAAEHPEQLLPRSCLVLGGEVSHWTYARELQSMSSTCKFFNHYGPTETTVGVSTYRIDGHQSQASRGPHPGSPTAQRLWGGQAGSPRGVEVNSATVPIGHPLANTQMYILDGRMQPVPIGIPGELFIGGDCLARGYLNRPELTAETFIPDPFSKIAGARLYRTGDLARYLIDGSIEFLGRLDHQVKIRGFRIELGEIEAALTEHPSVREALVLTDSDGGNGNGSRLVAYAVPELGLSLSSGDLRSFLKQKLPEHMLPSAFMLLDALPLTPHGKIDRRALPAPAHDRSVAEETLVAPSTPVEELLAEIWSQVLGVAYIGVDDNFFELGGDSILSIQIIARANQAGLRLTPKQLFQYQTIAGLAAVVGTGNSMTTPGAEFVIAAEQGPVTGDVPLTPIQHLFFEQNAREPHHYNQAVMLEVKEPLDSSLLEKAVEQLLVHHDALNLRFTLHEEGWRQFNSTFNSTPQGATPFRRFDLSALPAAEQSGAIEKVAEQMQSSLNLSAGPLMRVALFDLGERKPGRLLTVIHHLAVDGVSWRILLEDLLTAYRQLSDGEAVRLPAKTTAFKQWAQRLVEHAQSQAVQSELAYWLTQVEQRSSLPVDFPGGRNTRSSAGIVPVALDEEETHALLHEVPEVYHTQSNDLLLTALVRALSKWSGSASVTLALEGHGREEISADLELSRTVGWFTTIFPVVLDLRGARQPGDALQAIKEQLRRIPQRGIGYGLLRYLCLVESLTGQLEKLRVPLPEVSFNYLGQFDQVLPASAPFALAHESTGALSSLKEYRRHLLEITGSVIGNRLQMVWTYSENIHRGATVEKLARSFIEELRALIAHCQSPEAGGYTPSDFPLANLGQEQLNNVFARLGEEEFEAIDE